MVDYFVPGGWLLRKELLHDQSAGLQANLDLQGQACSLLGRARDGSKAKADSQGEKEVSVVN
jgi:hypothetical protein